MAKKSKKPNHAQGDLHSRYAALPAGFTAYDGKGCPFGPTDRVEHAILTADGIGITGLEPVKYHDWEWAGGKPGVGDVIAFRAVIA